MRGIDRTDIRSLDFSCRIHASSTATADAGNRTIRAAAFALLACVLAPAAAQTTCVPGTAADWMVVSDPLAQDIRPTECATVQQTPPDFRWPDITSDAAYQVTLTYPDGRTKTLAASQNWINWDEVLLPGTYSWRVTVTNSGGTQASRARAFIVDTASRPFLVPNMTTLLATITARPHPRGLPDATTLAAMQSQRQGAINDLLSEVSGRLNQSLPASPGSRDDADVYSKLALKSLMAYVYTKSDTYANDAVRRIMNLASWDPRGTTSYANYDMGARFITWTVAFGYDWLYPKLTSTQRSQILATLKVRNGDMYNDVIGTRSRIAKYPRDSHANQTLAAVPVIAVLLAGDLPEATTWVSKALPQAFNAVNPWGNEEGGFANAAAQGNWDVGELLPWYYVLRWATGINVAQKPWVRNWATYFAYFMPPGTPGGTSVFGDGFEINLSENHARYGKGYTHFAPSPLGRWHATQLKAEDPTRIEYLMSPPADFASASFPAGTPNSIHFKSIGQVAMHSDLSNAGRTSVYFKSSPRPYGAYNHSHADQNSFVVNAGGQRLAIESGYYDDYKTQHWWNWYHTTRAKNAITYDGGKGQLFYEQDGTMGYGAITRYESRPEYDIVSGDATQAYGGALTRAQRSLVYLRPNLILVYDNLASALNRQWEWNIHALNQMTAISDQKISIASGGQTLCIDMLAGPAMRFTQTNAWTSGPSSGAAQWHGKFYSTQLLGATEFIALMRVGCAATTASATKTSGVWTVPVGDKTVTISDSGISVATTGTTPPPPPPSPPPPTSGPQPYSGTPIAVPATIRAELFDRGGEGVAYHDQVPGNAGGQFRPEEDVDIIASPDAKLGPYVVNNFQTGEWMLYTINVPSGRIYDIDIRASTTSSTSAYHIEIDGTNVTGTVSVPRTGSWSTFKWGGRKRVKLTAGTHVLKIVADREYFNLNAIRLR
jgi:hypothetical protein